MYATTLSPDHRDAREREKVRGLLVDVLEQEHRTAGREPPEWLKQGRETRRGDSGPEAPRFRSFGDHSGS